VHSLTKQINSATHRLWAASIEGWDQVVKVLLDNKANVNFQAEGVTSLLMAAEGGHVSTFELLLSRGAKLTDRTRIGATALHGAALSGNLAMVQRVFKAGIDLHVEDKDHTTALGWAAGEGYTDIVVWLLSRGARANKPEESSHY
jgi:ankyrin repeat protein